MIVSNRPSTMFYYDLLVNSPHFSDGFFSYRSKVQLKPNQVVKVPFGSKTCLGLVSNPTPPSSRRRPLKAIEAAGGQLPNELVTAASRLAQRDNLATSELAQLLLANASLSGRTDDWPKNEQPPKINRTLTKIQLEVYEQIKANKAGQPQLLRGITGSGKTQIYIQLAQDCLASRRSCLILVPEIGLSRQVVFEFEQQIGYPIWHFHSQLTKASRQRIWRTLVANPQKACVVIGPRSSLLLPLANLGLVVLDEFHDDSFRQTNSPRYHSLHLAGFLAKEHKALILAGSATPNVEDYHRFRVARYPILHLTQKALPQAQSPAIKIIGKDRQPLTPEAIAAIKDSLENDAQALVFHNRRGSRRLIKCWDCNWSATCQNCDSNLVLHEDNFVLRCHRCNSNSRPPSACPNCQQPVVYSHSGTKDLQNQLEQLAGFWSPKADVVRFDSDNRQSQTLARQIEAIKDRTRQIIVGTRIVAKGLDLPKLKNVVVVDAESDLVTADYRVAEKSFQNISHLAGRVGRGHLKQTSVIIQTSQPKNPTLKAAANEQWLDFYHQEIERRRQAQLPPFSNVAVISLKRNSAQAAKMAAIRLRQRLSGLFPNLRWYQPLPASPERTKGGYQWLIHVFSSRRADLVAVSRQIKRSTATVDLDPVELFRGE